MQVWLFFTFFNLCAGKDLINLLRNFNKQLHLALLVFPFVNKKVWTDCQNLLKVAEFEVASETMFDHFADFWVSNLPDHLPSMFKQADVVVERTEKIVHVSEVAGQWQFVR